jgi:hypothetical protein
VRAGADVNTKNERGVSPLDLAHTIQDKGMLAVLTQQPGPCGTWEQLLEGKVDADFAPYA